MPDSSELSPTQSGMPCWALAHPGASIEVEQVGALREPVDRSDPDAGSPAHPGRRAARAPRPTGRDHRVTPLRAVVVAALALPAGAQDRIDWAGPPEIAVAVEASGFVEPVALAVVPEPSPMPDAPRFFVAERGGRIAVVTVGGEVLTFAAPPYDGGDLEQVELIDLVIAPEQGHVFVSYRSDPAGGVQQAGLMRFDCEPGTLSTAAQKSRSFPQLTQRLAVGRSFFGPLAVRGERLFVGVDTRGESRRARDPDFAAGKILRMDFAGQPAPDNPFSTPEGRNSTRDYVWATGLRRPVGLAVAGEVLYVADAGLDFDRVVRVERGGELGYDGGRWSLVAPPALLVLPAGALGAIAHAPPAHPAMPSPGGALLLSLTDRGGLSLLQQAERALLGVPLDPAGAAGRAKALCWPTADAGGPVDVAPDAEDLLLLGGPDRDRGSVLRLSDRPHGGAADAPVEHPLALIARQACFSCHNDRGGSATTLEPDVLAARLIRRLHSSAYAASLDAIDDADAADDAVMAIARDDVRETVGMRRVRTWMRHKLVEPRFDDPASAMPDHGLTVAESTRLVDYLLADVPDTDELSPMERIRLVITDLVPHPRQRHLLIFLLIGGFLGAVLTAILGSVRRRLKADRPGKV